MPITKSTHDVFSAIGEPKRRALIEKLVIKEMSVSELVTLLDWPQPMVSKHLNVLKQVHLVSERKQGKSRIYRIEPQQLKPIQTWVHQFEKYWGGALDQLDSYLTDLQNQGDAKE